MIRTGFFVLALALGAESSAAQSGLPALFDVQGVASDDVLNVREAPGVGAPIVGSFAPDARGIEVVDVNQDGKWGLVNTGERSGWTSMLFLARQPGPADSRFPDRLSCFGTEPFWSLELTEDGKQFEEPGRSEASFGPGDRRRSMNRSDRWAFFAERPGAEAFGVIARNKCGDGMSDRIYGLDLDLFFGDAEGLRLFSGCCTLTPE